MASSFATPDDVAAIWRPLTAAETTVATTLLKAASAIIRQQYPGIDDTGDPDLLAYVAASMVKAAMIGIATGDGATQYSETVGPFSRSASFANPTGNLFISAAMDAMLRGYRPRAMSVRYSN